MTNPTSGYFDTRSTLTANPRCFVARDWESDDAFTKLAFDYHAQFEPVGPVEIHLVDTLVQSDHEKRRVTVMQTQTYETRLAANAEQPSTYGFTCIEDYNGPRLLPKLARQIAQLERAWLHSLELLERYQKERRDRELQKAEAAAAAKAVEAAVAAEAAQAAKAPEVAEVAAAQPPASPQPTALRSVPQNAAPDPAGPAQPGVSVSRSPGNSQ